MKRDYIATGMSRDLRPHNRALNAAGKKGTQGEQKGQIPCSHVRQKMSFDIDDDCALSQILFLDREVINGSTTFLRYLMKGQCRFFMVRIIISSTVFENQAKISCGNNASATSVNLSCAMIAKM